MRSGQTKVTIVGGGVAALEALIALRALAEDRVAIEMITPQADWAYRPLAVAEPFGLGTVTSYDRASSPSIPTRAACTPGTAGSCPTRSC